MSVGMTKLRERLQGFKDKIEEAEERTAAAKELTKNTEAEADQHEVDRNSMKSRIALLKKELQEKLEKLDEKAARLAELTNKSTEEGEAVRELECVESEGDEQMADLESQLKLTQQELEQTDHRNIELAQKVLQTESELNKAKARCEKASAKIERLDEHIAEASESMKDLQYKDEDASERETVKEEMISFLATELKKVQQTAEDEERRVGRLERMKDVIYEEISRWDSKKKEVMDEMDGMSSLIEELNDDDDDVGGRSAPAAVTKPAREELPEPEPEPEAEEEDEEEEEPEEEDWTRCVSRPATRPEALDYTGFLSTQVAFFARQETFVQCAPSVSRLLLDVGP